MKRPHWRKMTWALVVFTGLMTVWIVAAGVDRPSKDCPPGDTLCVNASDTGTAVGVGLLVFLFFLGFVILSLVWFMSRPKGKP